MNNSRAYVCRSDGVGVGGRGRGRASWRLLLRAGLCSLVFSAASCNSFKNGWLDPTVVGDFENERKLEIRTSLTLDDPPSRIAGATPPMAGDLDVIPIEYRIMGGDTLAIEINELRQRQVPFQIQMQVSPTGLVNLPVVGEVRASGMTPSEFQRALVGVIQEKKVLLNPEVTVNPLFLQKATYSIFGIGVGASNNAQLRAGTFPIRRPDLRILDAVNQVGGLNEFVTELYVFRNDEPPGRDADGMAERSSMATPPADAVDETPEVDALDPVSPEDELFQVVEDSSRTPDRSGAQEGGVPEEMEPQAVDPFIFVDGEFVRNPAHPDAQRRVGAADAIPQQGTVIPATNWSRLAGDSSHRVIRIPAERLRAGDTSVDVVVRAGDVIRIVQGEIGVYYVMGQVNRVGPFAFNSEDITLKAAIAGAGGLSGLAWPDRCTVYRRVGASEQMVQVNLDRIFAGLDDDFLIRRGDIVNVGTHPFAPFLQRIRGLTLPNPTTNVGYGFTYARNFADIDSFAVQANPGNRPDLLQSLLVP